MTRPGETLQVQILNKVNIFCYCIVGSLSILSIVVGDTYDFIIGILTLFAIISSGLALAVPWLIFSVLGAQITTFFFMGLVEVIRLVYSILFTYYKIKFLFVLFAGIRIFAYFISSIVGILYVQKLIETSSDYTKMISSQGNKSMFI